jgi:hypothetical protein
MAGRLNRRLFLQHDALVCALLFSVNIALNTHNISIAPLWSVTNAHAVYSRPHPFLQCHQSCPSL